jgi:hypothetical protein
VLVRKQAMGFFIAFRRITNRMLTNKSLGVDIYVINAIAAMRETHFVTLTRKILQHSWLKLLSNRLSNPSPIELKSKGRRGKEAMIYLGTNSLICSLRTSGVSSGKK